MLDEHSARFCIVPEFTNYRVGDDGSVWSNWKGDWRPLNPCLGNRGYLVVALVSPQGAKRQFAVHRLVLEAFVGPCPEGLQCCHGDGVKTNNRLSNLRWDTPLGNWLDRIAYGGRVKLNPDTVRLIRQTAGQMGAKEAARTFGVAPSHVVNVRSRRRWRDLE